MKKRSVVVMAILAVLVLLALLFWWFWSLGNPPQAISPKLQLVIETGEVFIAPTGSQMMEKATSGMELHPGDRLKTADNSAASIMAYGKADVRLDQDTDLTVTQASDKDDISLVMRWQLQSGRVWSRVLRLLDLDSAYEGQANQVIATVRGTAFGMEADEQKTTLFVGQAGVSLAGVQTSDRKFMVGGHWAVIDSRGKVQEQGDASSSTWQDDPWIQANEDEDKKYASAADTSLMQGSGYRNGIPPDAWDYGLSRWSESLHLALAGQHRTQLWSEYTGRHLGYVFDLIQRGKSGLAFQRLTEIETDMQNVLSGNQGPAYRIQLKPIVGRLLLGLADVDPDSGLYRLKVRIEDLYAQVCSDDPAQGFYARSLSVDARLDEAERFDCKTQDRAAEAINAVEQGLAREKNDWGPLQAGMTDERRTILSEKMIVQDLRLAFLRQRLAACSLPPPGTGFGEAATSTAMATSTRAEVQRQTGSTNSIVSSTKPTTIPSVPSAANPPTTGQAAQNGQTDLGLTRIELYLQPSPAIVGDVVRFYVKGYKADGSSVDVTDRATFETAGGLGSLSETEFKAAKAGSGSFMATVADSGQSLTARASLTVNQPVTLSSISIAPAGGSLYYGQSVTLSVTAHYSNGFTQDVTPSVVWSLSNSLARMAGSTITAMEQPGSVTLTASYAENGVSQTASVDFQVTSSPTNALR